MSWHLAIETSQGTGGLAVRGSDGVVYTASLSSRSGIDDQLMPSLAALTKEAGCRPQDLSLVGVSIGPGGFTGLRIAVATAKMLGEVTGCTLIAVETALACARAHGGSGPLAVALASKRGDTWLSLVDGLRVVRAELVDQSGAEALLSGCRHLLADEHLPGPITSVAEALAIPMSPPVFQPEATLEVAEALAGQGEGVHAMDLSPLYPRAPEAVTLFEERSKAAQGQQDATKG
ncbi:MAG: tRNA (adenosine(37)-N6)-threonylcarbamoyltransferase complex dimerization subunit type 1 TsaB [Phycisphaerales bacterium]|nr:tRNA (adenosine(37)-N6)-threonylcarbamoyltransferase complex dimerization subunit type 1 TsaB [Phycisphaerales bacterium]